MKQGKLPPSSKTQVKIIKKGLEYYQAGFDRYGCRFRQAPAGAVIEKCLRSLLAVIDKVLEANAPKWEDIWTNKLTAKQEKGLVQRLKGLESMHTFIDGRSSFVKAGEKQEAAESCNSIFNLIKKFGETLETGEGWVL